MDTKFLCGFGRREITPPLGTPLVGYYKPRFSKGVIDPLFARAVVFQRGDVKSAILAVDLCLLSLGICDELRKKVSQALDIPEDAILINISHTHTGPLTGKDFGSDVEIAPEYMDFLKQQILAAAEEASKDLAPAKLFYAKTKAEGISFIRRFRLKDGSVKTNPNRKRDAIDYPLGEPNEDVRLLKVCREGADDVYIIHFGTHPDTVSGDYVSADWPGYVCSILEAAIPGSKAMFLLGPQGDVNHTNFRCTKNYVGCDEYGRFHTIEGKVATHARYMGRVIAGNVLSVCDKAAEIAGEDISFGAQKVIFPVNKVETTEEMIAEAKKTLAIYDEWAANPGDRPRPVTVKNVLAARKVIASPSLPDYDTYSVYAMKLGEFVISALPGEPFTDIGNRIYAGAGVEKMMVLCQTNCSCGYIPVSSAFNDGGYEANSSRFAMGTDDVLVNGALDVLKKL